MSNSRPLVAHIIYRLDIGGLENGLVNVINRCTAERFQHAVISLTDATTFRDRIKAPGTIVVEIGKRPGKDPAHYRRMWKVLRTLRPQILHTRNLATLEYQWLAAAARIPVRIHGEHGWDMSDLNGTARFANLLRRASSPLIDCYVAMSRHLQAWLIETVGLDRSHVCQIYSGVDTTRFNPRASSQRAPDVPFDPNEHVLIGTIGRMTPVKDHRTLVEAFLLLAQQPDTELRRLRLALIGDGQLLPEIRALVREAGATDLVWMPGARDDIPEILATFDLFVLPSLNEGISNTLLEAMASGLPVVATAVGGNPELVEEGVTGTLCAAAQPQALARALEHYARHPLLRRAHGAAGRARVETHFTLARMAADYLTLYDSLLATKRQS